MTVLRWLVRLVTVPLLPPIAVLSFVLGAVEGWQHPHKERAR